MKKIEAIIRPARFEELKGALKAQGVTGMTTYNVMGRGKQQEVKQYYRGQELQVDLFPKLKIEIGCPDEQVEKIVQLILNICTTGQIGDGKIFIYPLEEVVRISSGETNLDAL
jgi:nitrogen regulatory protein P-II 1